MNNREVERKLADAIAKTAPNDINGVLSRISDEKGTVLEVMKTKNNTRRNTMTFLNMLSGDTFWHFPNRVYMNPTMLQKEWKMLQQK